MSRDPKASEEFYREVVGLTVETVGEGSNAYHLLVAGGRPIGGLTGPKEGSDVWPSGGPAGHWVGYLATDDVDAAAERHVAWVRPSCSVRWTSRTRVASLFSRTRTRPRSGCSGRSDFPANDRDRHTLGL